MNSFGGRFVMPLFVALLALALLAALTAVGWLTLQPRGRVVGTLDDLDQTELTLINPQRQVLAVQLQPSGNIQTYLLENGLPADEMRLDYRGETAVSLYLPNQTIHDRPTIWPLGLIVLLTIAILSILLAPTRFEP